MSSLAYAERLGRALDATELLETVNKSSGDDQVSVLCRVRPGMEGKWVDLLKNMLIAEQEEKAQVFAWKSHVCRHYFLKNDNLVFGWNISIQSQDMTTSLDRLILVIRGGDPRAGSATHVQETMEMPLSGATDRRNQSQTGKGAHTIGGKSDFRPLVRR